MAILGISLRGYGLECADTPGTPVRRAVQDALTGVPPQAPIVVMIHGYNFTPERPADDPHRLIYAMTPLDEHWKIRSWPRGLGFTAGPADGLCIGFAWPATARENPGETPLAGNGFARVYEKAKHAGKALAHLLDIVAQLAPGRPIDIVAHSLGARVALKAVRHARHARVGRVILMGGAEFAGPARRCLERARHRPEVYNITARANGFYDLLLRLFAPRHVRGCTPLGFGMRNAPQCWVDLDIDAPAVARALSARGIQIGGRRAPVCHWGFYLRAGSFALYHAILRDRHEWGAARLRADIRAEGTDAVPQSGLLPLPKTL